MGLRHTRHNGTGTQCDWYIRDTMLLGRNGTETRWNWDITGLEHNGTWTLWAWDTMGLRHWQYIELGSIETAIQAMNGTGTHWD